MIQDGDTIQKSPGKKVPSRARANILRRRERERVKIADVICQELIAASAGPSTMKQGLKEKRHFCFLSSSVIILSPKPAHA